LAGGRGARGGYEPAGDELCAGAVADVLRARDVGRHCCYEGGDGDDCERRRGGLCLCERLREGLGWLTSENSCEGGDVDHFDGWCLEIGRLGWSRD
jgi:hypothetical protein